MTPSATACSKGLKLVAERESNARTYARTFDRLFTRGSLSTIWDSDGRDYIDLLACAGALPLGHNHPTVMAAVGEFLGAGHLQQGLDLATPSKLDFIEQLLSTLPPAFARDCRLQFCGPCGADAVEAALKLFKTATGRHAVIAFHGAYHGMTAGAMALMGNLGPKTPVPHSGAGVHFFPFPFPHARHCPFGVGGEEGETLSLRYLDRALGDPEKRHHPARPGHGRGHPGRRRLHPRLGPLVARAARYHRAPWRPSCH